MSSDDVCQACGKLVQTPIKCSNCNSSFHRACVFKKKKYKCTVCGYVYDPELGDPDGGMKPGTPFEKLPDDWVCPVCGASKDQFEKEEG